jgi:Ran GTPase-activating protein (RanGAP) involved in mRNA processing and transport
MEHLVNGILMDRQFMIEVLILDANKINDKQAILLAETLLVTSNKSLRVLSLGQNLITDFGVKIFSEMLDINSTSIRELRLHWNHITAKGGQSLAEALRTNRHLKILNLGWNSCGLGVGYTPGQIGKIWN